MAGAYAELERLATDSAPATFASVTVALERMTYELDAQTTLLFNALSAASTPELQELARVVQPKLAALGARAIKIEGRQRSPAYVEQVTRVWRSALDAYARAPQNFTVQPQWRSALDSLSEGSQTTLGAYHRSWQ